MEKLQNSKFQQLNKEEMAKLAGGVWWGWKVSLALCCADPNDGSQMSIIYWDHVNMFGNVDGRRESYD